MSDTYYDNPHHPAPGWYPDPWNASQERSWDGEEWTGYTRPRLVVAAQPGITPVNQYAYGLTWWGHFLWFLATLATFGLAGIGWFLHWSARKAVPRKVGRIR